MAPNLRRPPLASGEIHLWWIGLDACPLDPASLSAEERSRAARFAFARHRDRFIAAHVAMRSILAPYVQTDAHALRFVTAAAGKPSIDIRAHGPGAPAFNLSHSGSHAALVVARDGRIGVDLEVPRPDAKRGTLLDLLAPRERAAAAALDDAELSAAFLVAWTRKEACLKAVGSGFARRPQDFEVGLDPGPGAVKWAPLEDDADAVDTVPPDLDGVPRTVHVVTLQSPAGIPTSIARLDEPIAGIHTFAFPERNGDGGADPT